MAAQAGRFEFALAFGADRLGVITSYSIHYTKLYETIWAAANFLIFRRATPPVPSARRRRRLHLGIVAVAGLATLYWFVNAPDPRFGFGSFTALALALLAFSFRDVLPRPPARLARLAAHRSAFVVVAVAAVVLGGAALQSARGSKGLAAQPPTVDLGRNNFV